MGNRGSGESVTKTASDVAKQGYWDRWPSTNEEAWEACAAAVIEWHEAQQWRPMADAPRDGEFILVQYKAGHYSVLHWDDGCWWTKGRDRYADDSQCLRWRYPEAR